MPTAEYRYLGDRRSASAQRTLLMYLNPTWDSVPFTFLKQLTMKLQIERMNEVFTKYHLNPKGELPIPLRPVIHHFTGLEVGEQPHDHPFSFWSYVLFGGYIERIYTPNNLGGWKTEDVFRAPNTVHHVPGDRIHQIVGLPAGQSLTLIDAGPKEREPSFYKFYTRIGFAAGQERRSIVERRQWNEGEWKPF